MNGIFELFYLIEFQLCLRSYRENTERVQILHQVPKSTKKKFSNPPPFLRFHLNFNK